MTLLALVGIASAQPVPGAVPTETPPPADTKIPVVAPGTTEVMGAEVAAATSGPAPVSVEQPIDPATYVCGPGDVFELNFWGPQNFRLRIAVDLEGRTFISKVGYVAVAGKTLSAVRTAIKARVRGNYPGLQFDLTLVAPRSFIVHVAENVKTPGTYTARALERVSVLLARAGGSTGSRRRITIKHHTGEVVVADLVMYELTGDTKYNPFLLDGDVITVPFAQPVVTITGAVRRPGPYELVKTADLAELLALSGGFAPGVVRSLPIRIVRRDAHGLEQFLDVPFAGDAAPNAPLLDDDKVLVRGADELQRTVMLIGAVTGADPLDPATTSKRLPYVEGDTVYSLIIRAGGIKAPGDLHRSYISRPRAGTTPELIAIDLDALLVRRDFKVDKPIQIGDTIVVPPMQYSVLVEGAVARAGLYPFNPQFGITEYIAHAGGRTRTARDLDDVQLITWDGKTHPYRSGAKLTPGDAILVPERNFTRAEIVQIVLAGVGLVLTGVAVTIAATR